MTPKGLEAMRERAKKSQAWAAKGNSLTWCEADRAELLAEVDRLRAQFEVLASELYASTELDEGLYAAGRIWTVLRGPGHHNAMQGWIRDQDADR